VQIYGQTEVGGVISVLRIDDHVFDGPKAGKLGSAGRPTYSIAAKIVDPDDNEVPRGQNGEIICRSPGIMMGYLNNPDQTAQTLRNGWLHTGDIGYMDEDGYVFVVDRVKDMIVTGGENVHSSEVENAISAHPGISEIAVIAIPSEKWGEQVHAIVVPKPGEDITEQDIINHCKKLIAGYKCPKSVEVRSEPLPLSGVGKIQKNILREPYWKGKKRKVS
jgi:long-chain acyl-CoA synthetase